MCARGPVDQPREQGGAVWAAECRGCPLLAKGRDDEVVGQEPLLQLEDQVESPVEGSTDGRVMAFAFAVIFAAANVNRRRALEAGDSVACVEVEPEVTDLEGCHFCHAKAADGSEGDEEPVAVITEAIRAEAEQGSDQGAMYREEE